LIIAIIIAIFAIAIISPLAAILPFSFSPLPPLSLRRFRLMLPLLIIPLFITPCDAFAAMPPPCHYFIDTLRCHFAMPLPLMLSF
jgi:hypothetical protein